MQYVLTGLVIVLTLLFLMRRVSKGAVTRWLESDSAQADKELAKIIAREKQLMRDEAMNKKQEPKNTDS
jgi:hypothetical protein